MADSVSSVRIRWLLVWELDVWVFPIALDWTWPFRNACVEGPPPMRMYLQKGCLGVNSSWSRSKGWIPNEAALWTYHKRKREKPGSCSLCLLFFLTCEKNEEAVIQHGVRVLFGIQPWSTLISDLASVAIRNHFLFKSPSFKYIFTMAWTY